MKNKIICIHVYNGFTGSPNVLATVVKGLFNENYDVSLVTSLNNNGFLSNLNCSYNKNISYVFKKNKFLRLIQFLKFQIYSGFFVLKSSKNNVIYLNTIQPFFPAVIAKLKGNRIIYHFHESYPKMSLFTKFLYFVVEITANDIICVSDYVLNQLNDKCQRKAIVIHNSLSSDYFDKQINVDKECIRKNILMVSSAREYKGIFEFCKLATILGEYNFTLVCDASKQEILVLFQEYNTISNLKIIETQTDLHPFYAKTDLIVNLSIPSLFIETFGLTILEGMSYGIPCIVPPVGGITELFIEGVSGYKVDSRNTEKLVEKVSLILNDDIKYREMSKEALQNAKNFSFENFISKIKGVLG